jgi:hypothetical protein
MKRATIISAQLVFLLALTVAAAPRGADCWSQACDDLDDLGLEVTGLTDHAIDAVSRVAVRAEQAIEDQHEAARAEDPDAWFKLALRTAKQVDRLRKKAERARDYDPVGRLATRMRAVYCATCQLLLAETDRLREHPDYGSDDHLSRAIVAAESSVEEAQGLVEAGRPIGKALKRLRKGLRKLERLSRKARPVR